MDEFKVIIRCKATKENARKIKALLINKEKISINCERNLNNLLKLEMEFKIFYGGTYSQYDAIILDKKDNHYDRAKEHKLQIRILKDGDI